MTGNINYLQEEKRNKILDAAIVEFAQKGYEQASTNQIIKVAGISKGLLFHYFGTKKELYLEVIDTCIIRFEKAFLEKTGPFHPDILERLLEWSEIKLRLFYENPYLYKIIADAFLGTPPELKTEIASRHEKLYAANVAVFLREIDYSYFRDEINPQKALELVMLTLDALQTKYMGIYKNCEDKGLGEMPAIMEELKEYLQILKFGLYKQ